MSGGGMQIVCWCSNNFDKLSFVICVFKKQITNEVYDASPSLQRFKQGVTYLYLYSVFPELVLTTFGISRFCPPTHVVLKWELIHNYNLHRFDKCVAEYLLSSVW